MQPAARDVSLPYPDQPDARALVKRADDERLLAARLVTSRRPGQWVGAAVLLVLFAMLVHTVVTNGRFQWNVVGDYFVSRSIMDGLVLTLWLTAAVMRLRQRYRPGLDLPDPADHKRVQVRRGG